MMSYTPAWRAGRRGAVIKAAREAVSQSHRLPHHSYETDVFADSRMPNRPSGRDKAERLRETVLGGGGYQITAAPVDM